MGAPENPDRGPDRAVLKRIAWCAVVCLATTVAQAVGAEIGDFVGKPVVAVQLVSDGRPIHDAAVLELVETRVGVPLSMRQVRESVTHLFSLGLFETVEVDGSLLGDGVALEYDLIPLQVIERIEFEGNRGHTGGRRASGRFWDLRACVSPRPDRRGRGHAPSFLSGAWVLERHGPDPGRRCGRAGAACRGGGRATGRGLPHHRARRFGDDV